MTIFNRFAAFVKKIVLLKLQVPKVMESLSAVVAIGYYPAFVALLRRSRLAKSACSAKFISNLQNSLTLSHFSALQTLAQTDHYYA